MAFHAKGYAERYPSEAMDVGAPDVDQENSVKERCRPMPHKWLVRALVLCGGSCAAAASMASEHTVISCKFEHLPPMLMIIRGGMGATDNSWQVGQTSPVPLNVSATIGDGMPENACFGQGRPVRQPSPRTDILALHLH